jgi:hypothetical protein
VRSDGGSFDIEDRCLLARQKGRRLPRCQGTLRSSPMHFELILST